MRALKILIIFLLPTLAFSEQQEQQEQQERIALFNLYQNIKLDSMLLNHHIEVLNDKMDIHAPVYLRGRPKNHGESWRILMIVNGFFKNNFKMCEYTALSLSKDDDTMMYKCTMMSKSYFEKVEKAREMIKLEKSQKEKKEI